MLAFKPIAVLLALGCVLLAADVARAEWLSSYLYRQEITVNAGLAASNLTDLPLLVKIDNSSNHLFANAGSSGGQGIVFTAADGTTELDREIDYFSNGATKELDAWVKTDVSSTAPTTLYMYYNGQAKADAANTWDDNFLMVQHFQESGATAGSRLDSKNDNDGTAYQWVAGSGDTIVDLHTDSGRIGGADELVGTGNGTPTASNRIQVPDSDSLDQSTGALTIEAWIRPDLSQASELIAKGAASQGGTTPYELWLSGTSFSCRLNYLTGDSPTYQIFSVGGLTIGQWSHVVATYDSSLSADNFKLYIDGVLKNDWDVPSNRLLDTNASPLVIGSYQSGLYPFDGIIDEVRISDINRGADWLAAAYDNVNDPGLLTFGEAEVIPEPASLALLLLGLLSMPFLRSRRR